MKDRWQNRPEPEAGQGTIYWHILLRDHSQVRAMAREVQERLSGFPGLHATPHRWLHITTLVVGSTDQISAQQRAQITREATQALSGIQPISITLGRILYHPEAIMLSVQPERALEPILEGVRMGTRKAAGVEGTINGSFSAWKPHVTVAYSTAEQPAAPIIARLGKNLSPCTVQIDAVSLVVQWGPERLWNWEPIETIQLPVRL